MCIIDPMKRMLWLSVPAILVGVMLFSGGGSAGKIAPGIIEHFRLSRELPPVISHLRTLENQTLNPTSTDPKLWSSYDESARVLQAQAKTLNDDLEADCLWVADGLNEENRPLVADLASRRAVFSATLNDNVGQLARIVSRLRRLTVEPGSWTRNDYQDAVAAYTKTRLALDTQISELAAAIEKIALGRSNWKAGYNFSFIYFGAAGFWCSLLILFFFPGLKESFSTVFSLPPPASQAVIKPFDALRGLSALWVALYHISYFLKPFNIYTPTSNMILSGDRAVPVFVTMSAFLIFRTVGKIVSWPDLGAYFKRRWLRIYPLYFTVLFATLLCGHWPPIAQFGWKRLAAEFLMLRVVGYPAGLIAQAWSLYVEEAFYILIPAWFFIFRKRISFAAIASYAAVSVASVYYPGSTLPLWRYFCVGVLLTELIDRPLEIDEWAKWSTLLIGTAAFFLSIDRRLNISVEVSFHLLAFSIFCVLWAAVNIGSLNKVLSLYPLRFLGIISYSMYMWHMLILITGMPIRFNIVNDASYIWFGCV